MLLKRAIILTLLAGWGAIAAEQPTSDAERVRVAANL